MNSGESRKCVRVAQRSIIYNRPTASSTAGVRMHLSNTAVFAGVGGEKMVPFSKGIVQYIALNIVQSGMIWQKKNSIGLQVTIASGCLGCWFLHELLPSELAAKWSSNVSPTAGKTQEKYAIAS